MAKNIFSLSFILNPQQRTIKKSAETLISLIDILRKKDDAFSIFKVSKLNFKSVAFDLNFESIEDAIQKLSETILKFHKSDIQQYEKEENPTIDFSRDLGFRFLLQFNKHFSITGNISSNQFASIAIEYFPFGNSDYDFDWYFNILKKTNEFLNPIFSGVNIILPQYMEMYLPLNVVYPLGWVTYFSNESDIKMPSDIGFETIQEEKGQYVIATREDFTQSKESFFAMKDKLVDGMKALKNTCVEYSETE